MPCSLAVAFDCSASASTLAITTDGSAAKSCATDSQMGARLLQSISDLVQSDIGSQRDRG